MYFSNLNNSELQYFSKTINDGFSISLTDLLESNLFNVETIITGLYRICPLFYFEDVVSNNPNDKLLNKRCLIITRETYETYLTFTSIENNKVYNLPSNNTINTHIGNTLNTNDFNKTIYLLRKTKTIDQTINFKNNTKIITDYCTIEIGNTDKAIHNNNGLIINDYIKENELLVKLTNPLFRNAKYTLTFTVFSLTGMNVCETNKDEFITRTSFTIEAKTDLNVSLDLSEYVNDSVLDYDVVLNVSFDVPEISSGFNLSLVSDVDFVASESDLTLTAGLSHATDSVKDYVVIFYENNTLIGSSSTNTDGIASLTYTPTNVGVQVYSAQVLGLKKEINVRTGKYTTSISNLNVSKQYTSRVLPDTITFAGTLNSNGGSVNNQNIKIYDKTTLIDPVTTNANGEFSKTINTNHIEHDYYLYAEYGGDFENKAVKSATKIVNVKKIGTNITVGTDKEFTVPNSPIKIRGVLSTENNTPLPNMTVKLDTQTSITDENGAYEFTITKSTEQTKDYNVTYDGDSNYQSSVSETITVRVKCADVYIQLDGQSNASTTDEVTLTATITSDYTGFNFDVSKLKFVVNSVEKAPTSNSSNKVSLKLPAYNQEGTVLVYAKYIGDPVSNSTRSEQIIITYKYNTKINLTVSKLSNGTWSYGATLIRTSTNKPITVSKPIVLTVGGETTTLMTNSSGFVGLATGKTVREKVSAVFAGDKTFWSCSKNG